MKDEQLMRKLLQEMSDSDSGSIMETETLGMSKEKRHKLHQLTLLCDSGLAVKSGDTFRITNTGYKFLETSEFYGGD